MQVTRTIDHRLYPRKALTDARQAYRDYCTLSMSPRSAEQAQIVITVRPEYEDRGREVVLEFLNYLLDRAAQIRLEAV